MKLYPRDHYENVKVYFDEPGHNYYKRVKDEKTGEFGNYIKLNNASSLNQFSTRYYNDSKSMDKWILSQGQKRGKAFHKMIQEYLQKGSYTPIGSLTLQRRMPVFIEWLDDFLKDKDVLLVEEPLCARELLIAGTPDLVVWDKTDEKFMVVDWKSGTKPANKPKNNPTRDQQWELGTIFEPQLRYYAFIIADNFHVNVNRMEHLVVWLQKSGRIKTHGFS